MGTRGLIFDNRGNNEQKQIHTDQLSVHNSQDKHKDNENLANNEEHDDGSIMIDLTVQM